ncbi:MAG: cytochrome P460 family protein [Balneolaceae bacterium]|nr:cytochrome P460 family protein [Balneolaceae bacterium]
MKDRTVRGMKISIAAIFSALLLIACGTNDSDMEEEPDPQATGMAVWNHLEQENYQDTWRLFPGTEELYEGTDPHGSLLTIYLNDVAYDAAMNGENTMPYGAIIVKENHMPDSTLVAITTMYKVQDYNPKHNDWFWLRNNAEGVIDVEGRIDGCQSCHQQASATDYVFTEPPAQ